MGAEIPSLAEVLAQPLAEPGYVASGFASAHLVDVQAYGDEVAVAAPTADAMYENGGRLDVAEPV